MKVEMIDPAKLKFRENVRWRADTNLSELMTSIKQHGIQSPIKARKEDMTIIFGHRRTAAAMKLNMNLVPVIFESGISDKEANILNLLENMQRKDVTSIEIGRQCDLMIKSKEFKINVEELSVILGVSSSRIKACLGAYRSLPAKFREQVVHITSSRERKVGELPENVVSAILNFSRVFKKLNDKEINYLLEKTAEEKLTISQINLIGRLMTRGMNLKQAIKEVNLYVVSRIDIVMLKSELEAVFKKTKLNTKISIVNKALKEIYPGLVF